MNPSVLPFLEVLVHTAWYSLKYGGPGRPRPAYMLFQAVDNMGIISNKYFVLSMINILSSRLEPPAQVSLTQVTSMGSIGNAYVYVLMRVLTKIKLNNYLGGRDFF